MSTPPSDPRPTLFIIRPWNDPRTSLYPHIMDGVEYVEAVIEEIERALGGKSGPFNVRYDKDVFLPGRTLRQNLDGELESADVVIAILDGLRPNVVFELGLARGLRLRGDSKKPHVVCVYERDATILVRNYYPSPLEVPTLAKQPVAILNPRLDINKAFSDASGELFLVYDRLRLNATLGDQLGKALADFKADPPTQPTVDEGIVDGKEGPPDPQEPSAPEKPTTEPGDLKSLWSLYEQERYGEVVAAISLNSSAQHRKLLALSLMKSRRLSRAVQVWRDLLLTGEQVNAARFHLGICYYAMGDYEAAKYWFTEAARDEKDESRTSRWIARVDERLQRGRPTP